MIPMTRRRRAGHIVRPVSSSRPSFCGSSFEQESNDKAIGMASHTIFFISERLFRAN